MTAAKRVCRFLKRTVDLKLMYAEQSVCETLGYSNAGWAGSRDDRHSKRGNVFMIGGAAVSWLSKRQGTVVLSTAEAEYVALTSAFQKAVWMLCLLQTLGVELESCHDL